MLLFCFILILVTYSDFGVLNSSELREADAYLNIEMHAHEIIIKKLRKAENES
jgi:hypothetical protein